MRSSAKSVVATLSFSKIKSWVALSFLCPSVRRASVTSPLISTVWWFRPYKSYIFWKLLVQGYQNWYYQVSHTQIHKYRYTNTQIHTYSIWQSARKTQHVVYFWKDDCSRLSKMTFPWVKHANTKIQIHKYKNTQIHHMPKCQKDPAGGLFLKKVLFKDIFWVSHSCTRSGFSLTSQFSRWKENAEVDPFLWQNTRRPA